VSGLGPTRRIVVYDTMLTEATPDEVVSVVAHELGHARTTTCCIGTLLGALGTAAAVIALFLLGSWPGCCGWPASTSIGEPRAIGLVLAVVTVAGLVGGPAQAFVSRRIEARADAHALELTGDPATFEAMQRRLAPSTCPTRIHPPGSTPVPPRTRPRWSGWPPPARTPGASADGPHAAGHQRLPAPAGGIQQFVHNLAVRQPAGSVVVYASTWQGADEVRRRAAVRGGARATGVLLPTPAVARRAAELARAHGCDRSGSARPPRSGCSPTACAAPPGIDAGGRAHPRARDRLGRAARRRGLLRRIAAATTW
jgi:hypothetical protein